MRHACRLTASALLILGSARIAAPQTTPDLRRAPAVAALADLPLAFEQNDGQAPPDVRFLARTPGYTVWLSETGPVFSLPGAPALPPVRMRFSAGESPRRTTGVEPLPGRVSYLVGADRARWRSGISTYRTVRYDQVAPGVDVVCYGTGRRLEFDFIVTPGADPSAIALSFDADDAVRVDASGDLLVGDAANPLRLSRPEIYQETGDGERTRVSGRYTQQDERTVRFSVDAYDASRPLVIDPVVIYSTYLPGDNQEAVSGIAVDAAGNAYVIGTTSSPGSAAWQRLAGYPAGNGDVFVSKINAAGTALVYSVFFGGTQLDVGAAIAVDAQGHAYITGYTQSANFPLVRAIQPTMGGSGQDSFVAKLNPAGTDFDFSTYFGGVLPSRTAALAIDAAANIYVAGVGEPPTSRSIYGSGNAFVSKLTSDGQVLLYSTKLGGSGFQQARGVAVDPNGHVYVAGLTGASDFPTLNAVQPVRAGGLDAFVVKIASSVQSVSMFADAFDAENGGLTALDYTAFTGFQVTSGSADLVGSDAPDFVPGNGSYVRLGGAGAAPSLFESRQAFRFAGHSSIYPAANPSYYRLAFTLGSAPAGASGLGPIVTVRIGSLFSETFSLADNVPLATVVREFAVSTETDARVSFELVGGGASALVDAVELSQLAEQPAIAYATYLGGSLEDGANGIAADASGAAYVVGYTASPDFPLAGARQPQFGGAPSDAFIATIDPAGHTLAYSSFFGGSSEDVGNAIALDPDGNVYLAGATSSSDMPTVHPVQGVRAGPTNAFVAKLTPSFDIGYSTYLGGEYIDAANAIAADALGNAYVGGQSNSTGFPVDHALFAVQGGGADGFVAKILDAPSVEIVGLSQTRGGNAGSITVLLRGINFEAGAVTVTLSANGRPDIVATSAVVVDGSTIRVVFNLQGEAPGSRNVVVTFASGASVTLANAFTVEAGGAADLWIDFVGRASVRRNAPSAYYLTFGNQGNVDSGDALFWIAAPAGVTVDAQVPYLEDIGALPDPPVVVDGDTYTWFYVHNLGAGDARSLLVRLTVAAPEAQIRTGIMPGSATLAAIGSPVARVRDASIVAAAGGPSSIDGDTAAAASASDAHGAALQSDDPQPGDIVFKLSDSGELPTGHVGLFAGEIVGPDAAPLACSPRCVVDMTAIDGGRIRAIDLETWAQGRYIGAGRPPGATPAEAAAAVENAKEQLLSGVSPSYLVPPVAGRADCVSAVSDWYRATGYHVPWLDYAAPAVVFEATRGEPWPERLFNAFRLMNAFTAPAALSGVWPLLFGRPTLTIHSVQAVDPNDKSGSQGVGPQQYVSGAQPLRYAISFENIAAATAAARDVVVTDDLDPSTLDLTSVSLGPIAFGDRQIVPPAGVADFSTVVDLRPAANVNVGVAAHLDRQSGRLTWRFTTLDPATGQPPDDPTVGFLPPNVDPPEGDGSVFITMAPHATLPTGTVVSNRAAIVFDANAAIETAVWSNTIDRTKPSSQLSAQLSSSCGTNIALSWSGSDAESGIADYTVFVSDNGGPYAAWLSHTTATSRVFAGAFGHSYAFYSVARDGAGNVEETPGAADAFVTVADTVLPTLVCPASVSTAATSGAGAIVNYPVTASDNCGVPQLSCSPASGALFSIGSTSVNCTATDVSGNSASCSFPVTVTAPARRITALGPANVWIGLTNSDDVGIRFDVRAEVYAGAALVGSGELASVAGGSSGFNNARLNTVPVSLAAPVDFPAGASLSAKIYVRNACTGSGKNSGRARIWYNDAAANTRIGTTIDSASTFYLLDGFAMGASPGGGPKKTIDVVAGAKCSPFKLAGTWSVVP